MAQKEWNLNHKNASINIDPGALKLSYPMLNSDVIIRNIMLRKTKNENKINTEVLEIERDMALITTNHVRRKKSIIDTARDLASLNKKIKRILSIDPNYFGGSRNVRVILAMVIGMSERQIAKYMSIYNNIPDSVASLVSAADLSVGDAADLATEIRKNPETPAEAIVKSIIGRKTTVKTNRITLDSPVKVINMSDAQKSVEFMSQALNLFWGLQKQSLFTLSKSECESIETIMCRLNDVKARSNNL